MSDNTKIAVVIGGSGVVGRELIEQLAQADYIREVKSLTRRPIEPTQSKVKNHVVDFENLDATRDLFTGDVFFSCLGTTRKAAGSVAAQRRVDVDYQLKCAQLALAAGVGHCLLVSSSGANRFSALAYPKMKGQLEHAIKQLGFARLTIVQPSLLIGERDDRRIGEEIGSAFLPLFAKFPGFNRFKPIRGAEVAERLVLEGAKSEPGLVCLTLDQIFIR